MRNFFKIFFASLLACIVFTLLLFFVVVGMASGLADSEKPTLNYNSVLVIDLASEFKEQSKENVMASFTGSDDADVIGIFDLTRLIESAKTDPKVSGIYIKCNTNNNGFATNEAIRNALLDFKKSNKFIYAYGEMITQKSYYVAQVANKIYCNPKGMFEWKGLAATVSFFKETLQKLEIEPQIFYAGKFKSATEPFRETQMTEANRIQTTELINDLFGRLVKKTSEERKIDSSILIALANDGTIISPTNAFDNKLIDGLKYDDEVKAEIIMRMGMEKNKPIEFLTISKYKKASNSNPYSADKIAIIYAEGDIVDGQQEDNVVASDVYRTLIVKARNDKNIKAVVLRVNSPGGSALASEVIWRELMLTKKVKPVVVSMGDVAASGGYYISCAADSVFAEANTITGSIGVFGIIPNMQQFFKNKLGITFDVVKTSTYADMGSINRPLTTNEKKIIQSEIDSVYYTFKTRVSNARKIKLEDVEEIAQGRVWTGSRAVQIGLVDRIASLKDAVKSAATLAKISTYKIKEYPEQVGWFEKIKQSFNPKISMKTIKEQIGEEAFNTYIQIQHVKKMVGKTQMKLPFTFEIK